MEYKYYALELLVRSFTGILFLFQGYDKLFKVKISGVIQTFNYQAQVEHVPGVFVKLMAAYTSIVEFGAGLFLILGLFKTYALTFLGIDILLVAIAFSTMEAMWDMKHVYPRLVLISALLMFPTGWEYFSIDHVLSYFITK